jgi:hypothetical protein
MHVALHFSNTLYILLMMLALKENVVCPCNAGRAAPHSSDST